MAEVQGSKPLQMNSTDLKKAAMGLLMAVVGAALAYISTEYIPLLQESSDSEKLFLAAILSAAVNFLRKWVTDQSKVVTVLKE